MSLTDDWKAGKLQNGWYFCQFENGEIFPALCFDNDFDDCQLRVVKVLAPCDYEELERLKAAKSNNRYFLNAIKDMKAALDYMTDENEKLQIKYNEDIDKLMRQIVNGREWEKIAKSTYPYRCDTIVGGVSFITVKEENKKLRSLLKSCRNFMITARKAYALYPNPNKILTRINATIGESEE